MQAPTPQYVIWVGDEPRPHTARLPTHLEAYLLGVVENGLRPLSDEEYVSGHAAVVFTLAPSSYILAGEDVYWCVPWAPGLLVTRFSSDGSMRSAAFRSPRKDEDHDDELSIDSIHYRVIFFAWDSQFDGDHYRWNGFAPADADVADGFDRVMAKANELQDQVEETDQAAGLGDHHADRLHFLKGWIGRNTAA